MDKQNTITKIHTRYKIFQKEQRDIWESFCLVDFYAPKIKDAIKADEFPTLQIDRIWNDSEKTLKKDATYGALSSLTDKGNYRRTLLEAVLIFENYMTDLIEIVYLDFPGKLHSNKKDSENDNDHIGHSKLIKLILESSDKEEIIDKLVEEKIRGIFYGNPLDVFEKDKAKLEFGTYFKENHKNDLKKLKSIIAIRNIIAHNNGIIDRKYIRESDNNAKLGNKVKISREFLKETIYIISNLTTHATRLILENIYNTTPQGNLGKSIKNMTKR